jgi:hypothetical protein
MVVVANEMFCVPEARQLHGADTVCVRRLRGREGANKLAKKNNCNKMSSVNSPFVEVWFWRLLVQRGTSTPARPSHLPSLAVG